MPAYRWIVTEADGSVWEEAYPTKRAAQAAIDAGDFLPGLVVGPRWQFAHLRDRIVYVDRWTQAGEWERQPDFEHWSHRIA